MTESNCPSATIKKYLIVQTEGTRQVKRLVDHYNLEMILAVGYRVRSRRGVQFRQWATARLMEYLVKGFALDDERLKGESRAADYFDELLARIREIRASEARVYLMVRNIFALACDYEEGSEETQRFFAMMQNKMHFAAHRIDRGGNRDAEGRRLTPEYGADHLEGLARSQTRCLDGQELSR